MWHTLVRVVLVLVLQWYSVIAMILKTAVNSHRQLQAVVSDDDDTAMSCHVMSCHVMSRRVMSRCVIMTCTASFITHTHTLHSVNKLATDNSLTGYS